MVSEFFDEISSIFWTKLERSTVNEVEIINKSNTELWPTFFVHILKNALIRK